MATEGAAGMVAVVQGLQDAGLAVTLYDNGKQFTLAPNSFKKPQSIQNQCHHPVAHQNLYKPNVPHINYANQPIYYRPHCPLAYPEIKTTATDAMPFEITPKTSQNTGTQVIDGRYASVYQATICKMQPTNPIPEITEFPPQCVQRSRGASNFVVGGSGSGDTRHKAVHIPNSYRGGLSWTDKESVCSPRPSVPPDKFAKSLRSYPRMPTERSSEIIERLITYTQAKNFGKNPSQQCSRDPGPLSEDRTPKIPGKISRGSDSPYNDQSPTRDRPKLGASEPVDSKNYYGRNYDVRYLRDFSKSIRDNILNASLHTQNYQRSNTTSPCRQRSPNSRKPEPQQHHPSTVHSEIQAAVKMVCRQVETAPRVEPWKRTVTISCTDIDAAAKGGEVPPQSTQIQATHSAVEIPSNRLILDARKSKSSEEIGNKYEKQNETAQTLEKSLKTEEVKLLQNKIKKSTNLGINNLKDSLCVRSIPSSIQYRNNRKNKRKISKDFSNTKTFRSKNYDMFRAEVDVSKYAPKDNVTQAVRSWLMNVPLKKCDVLGRPVKKDQTLSYVVRRIKMIPKRIQIDKKKFRSEISDIVDDVPFNMGCANRNISFKKITEDLIRKLEYSKITSAPFEMSKKFCTNKYIINTANNFNKITRPTEEEIRNFVRNELMDAIHKSHLDISFCKARDVEDELVDVLYDTLEDVYIGKDREVMEDIVLTLEEIGQILRFQASYFARILLNNFRKKLNNKRTTYSVNRYTNVSDSEYISNKVNSMVFKKDNVTTNMQINASSKCCENSSTCKNSTHSAEIQEQNCKSHMTVDNYKQQLSKKIEEWFNTIEIRIPQGHRKEFHQIIVKELVDDIVDRQKYLALNTVSCVCETDEIEHLRYQIFKWIFKLVGENSTNTLEGAPTLMQIIRSIPAPEIKYRKTWKKSVSDDCQTPPSTTHLYQQKHINAIHVTPTVYTLSTQQIAALEGTGNQNDQPDAVFTYTRQQNSPKPIVLAVQNTIGRSSPGPSAIPSPQNLVPPLPKSIGEMNTEFMNYLTDWVNSIPLPPDTPQEQKIRQGFLQGLMQAITKIKSSPVISINPLYYEDALDDELETLFSLLPQTNELLAKKPAMKAQMIIKNCYINEKIKQALAPNSFGQHVRDEVSVYVPRTETREREDDKVKLYEELKILFLAEEYIMFLRYREEDEMKANVYKVKLLRRIQEFVHDLKQIHNAELQNIDENEYMDDILTAMQKVPLPSEETIKQEADEVMLGMEIDKWFFDLPLAANDSVIEQYRRRRLRDQLAKKVYEMEKDTNMADETREQAFRHEVSLVLDKLPLNENEDLKINFMVDELTNRIKNRHKGNQAERKKSVEFDEAANKKFGAQTAGNLNFQQPLNVSGRWVNVPGTPMAIDEAQTMKDAAGRMWFTLDPRPTMQPTVANQSIPQNQQGLSLVGAAQALSGGSRVQHNTGLIPQAMQQPGMPMQRAALPIAAIPPTNVPATAFAQSSAGANDQNNNSMWLSKAVQDYEAKRPYLISDDRSIQFGPPRPTAMHEMSQTENYQPAASSSYYQPLSAQVTQQTQSGFPLQSRKPHTSKQSSLFTQKEEQRKEAWPYSLASHSHNVPQQHSGQQGASQLQNANQLKQQQSIDQSIMRRMGPNISVVDETSPGSEFFSIPIASVGPPNLPPTTAQEPYQGQLVSMSARSRDPAQLQSIDQQNISRAQQSVAQQVPKQQQILIDNTGPGSEFFSIPVASVGPPTWGPTNVGPSSPSAPYQGPANLVTMSPARPANTSYQAPANQTLKDPSEQSEQQDPAQEATGSMWLSVYMKDYAAKHPNISQPPGNSSIQRPNVGVSVMPPPEYGAFGQERPLSSSMHQQLEQSLGGPVFDRSVAMHHPRSLPLQSPQNVSANGINISRPGVPGTSGQQLVHPMPGPLPMQASMQTQVPIQSQSVRSGVNASVLSAGLQAPDFYKSTDREGIQQFTVRNKTLPPRIQQPATTITSGSFMPYQSLDPQRFPPSVAQASPAMAQILPAVTRTTPAVAQTVPTYYPPFPPQATATGTYIPPRNQPPQNPPPNFNVGMPLPPPKEYDDTGNDSDGQCKCLKKIKMMKKMGLCSRCNTEMNYPRYPPPCPWY